MFLRLLYIIHINTRANSITLGTKKDTYFNGLIAKDLNFLYPLKKRRLDVNVKIRYNQQEVKSRIYLSNLGLSRYSKALNAKIEFAKPLSSVAPGQAVVFYDGDKVIGGGRISKGVR